MNVSEGRDHAILDALAATCGALLLDVHSDPDHHRAVYTLAGDPADVEDATRDLTRVAVASLDLGGHEGCHPRIGVVDVVPFVPFPPPGAPGAPEQLGGTDLERAVGARDRFAAWAAAELELPCFLYGPLADGSSRTLPEIRRCAFTSLTPDTGPPRPHPTAGASAVGARPVLIAYNLWIEGADVAFVRQVAASLRGPGVRTLGLDLAQGLQLSCNLIEPFSIGPAQFYDAAGALLEAGGARVRGAELVGLVPAAVLEAIPARRWAELGLSADRTVEARLAAVSGHTRGASDT